MKLRYSVLAVSAALALGSNLARADEAAAKLWIDKEIERASCRERGSSPV